MKTKGIKKTVSNAKKMNCFAIIYNIKTDTVDVLELLSKQDEPERTLDEYEWAVLAKWGWIDTYYYGNPTMDYVRDLINDYKTWL